MYSVRLWKEIKKEAVALEQLSEFSVGNGRWVCF